MNDIPVDLCVNCYERTYRTVLKPGFFPALSAEQQHSFARRTAIINNISDREDATRLAEHLRASGELDAWFFVEDHIARALAVAGLREEDISRAPHFTDWGLVMASVTGPDWLVHCDAEVRLREQRTWISPSIAMMMSDPRLMIANPRWHIPVGVRNTLEGSTFERQGDFAIGLGFSDQLFLARRSELAAPIYSERCLAAWRYPMIGVTRSFEARIDSWMRHHDRLRATFLGATYEHPPEIGGGYSKGSLKERGYAFAGRCLIAAARRSPVKRHCWRAL